MREEEREEKSEVPCSRDSVGGKGRVSGSARGGQKVGGPAQQCEYMSRVFKPQLERAAK